MVIGNKKKKHKISAIKKWAGWLCDLGGGGRVKIGGTCAISLPCAHHKRRQTHDTIYILNNNKNKSNYTTIEIVPMMT